MKKTAKILGGSPEGEAAWIKIRRIKLQILKGIYDSMIGEEVASTPEELISILQSIFKTEDELSAASVKLNNP